VRDSFRDLRERLEAAGFRPSRRLGQNFLVDPNLAAAIVGELGPIEGRLCLEIGAGTGALTRRLAEAGARVLAVEKDPRLQAFLEEERKSWGGLGERVRILATDALDGGRLAPGVREALAEERPGRAGFDCASNLPYSVAGPCLAALAVSADPPERLLVLCQREMGERLLSGPGEAAYGSLSVLLGRIYRGRRLREVPPEVFRPRPRVESVLCLFERRPQVPIRDAEWREAFGRFLQGVFGGRRKTLRNALRRLPGGGLPSSLDRELLSRRPGELSPGELERIFEALEERGAGGQDGDERGGQPENPGPNRDP